MTYHRYSIVGEGITHPKKCLFINLDLLCIILYNI